MFAIFEKLKKEDLKTQELSSIDKAILISTLLVECARSDDNFTDTEKEQIKKILKNKLHLDSSEVEKNVLKQPTKALKKALKFIR